MLTYHHYSVFLRPVTSYRLLLSVLTVRVLIRQPVVLGVLVLKERIPLLALVLSEVFKQFEAFLRVTQLELVTRAIAGAATIGRAARKSKVSTAIAHRSITFYRRL